MTEQNQEKDLLGVSADTKKIELLLRQGDIEEEISLVDLIKKLWNGRRLIILMTIIGLVVGMLGATTYQVVLNPVVATTSTGLRIYVDTTTVDKKDLVQYVAEFDIKKLKDEEVLKKAVELAELTERNVDLKQLKNAIEITDTPLQDTQPIDGGINKNYTLELNVTKSMNVNAEEGQKLLDSLIESYKLWIINTYVQKDLLVVGTKYLDLADLDYIEVIRIMKSDVNNMQLYLQDKVREASIENEHIFDEAIAKVDVFKKCNLKTTEDLINDYSIAKDSSRLPYEYGLIIENIRFEKEKLEAKIKAQTEVMEAYRDKESIVIVDDQGNYTYPTRRELKTTYDALTEDLMKKKENLIDLEYEIEKYTRLKARVEGKQITNQAGTKELEQVVSENVQSLTHKMQELTEKITDTMNTYYDVELLKSSVTQEEIEVEEDSSIIKMILIIMVMGLLGAMLGAMVVLGKEAFKQKEEQTEMK